MIIDQPGVYDIPEDVYHADPVPGGSLSVSGAKKLLVCPARFRYDADQPPQSSAAMELGTAAHKLVLGLGSEIVTVVAEDWRTKAAREERDAARAAGKVPLLYADYERASLMAAMVRTHPVAGALFSDGEPERSLFWVDEETGIWRRARLDWLGRFGIVDLKSCASASPAAITKAMANYGYHIQAPWYVAGVRALGLHDDPDFIFVFVETAQPHLVTIARLEPEDMAAGHELGRLAIERYRDCTEAGVWPAYSDEIVPISLPPWAFRAYQEVPV